MVTKRKEAAVKPAGRGKAPAARATARSASGSAKAADPMVALLAERDALRKDVAMLRAKVEALTSVRAELETRLESAASAVKKLLGQ